MNLIDWSRKWGVPGEAMRELLAGTGIDSTPGTNGTPEGDVQNLVRLEASKKGLRLWRNNNGACYDDTGRFIRYGLANDSKKVNDVIKSSDLIGIRPVLITQEKVGTTIGQFVAREVKRGGWLYSGTKRELAQFNFINLVSSLGGDAAFTNREGSL